MNAHVSLTDEAVVADLRERGMVGPISDDFVAGIKRDREFAEAIDLMNATPGTPERFKRALVRCGIIPPSETGDETLLAAWGRFQQAERDLEASGSDASEEQDAPATAVWEAADGVIFTAPATTLDGAIVKLRRSLLLQSNSRWACAAIVDDDPTTLFAKADEFDGPSRLAIDALAAMLLVKQQVPA